MAKLVCISFKQTTKDTELLLAIEALEEKSSVIKDILYKHLVKANKEGEGKDVRN